MTFTHPRALVLHYTPATERVTITKATGAVKMRCTVSNWKLYHLRSGVLSKSRLYIIVSGFEKGVTSRIYQILHFKCLELSNSESYGHHNRYEYSYIIVLHTQGISSPANFRYGWEQPCALISFKNCLIMPHFGTLQFKTGGLL